MRAQALFDLRPDAQQRIERRERIVKDHRDPAAADARELLVGQREQLLAEQLHPPRELRAVGQQAQQRQRRTGLAAARLADEGQRLAAFKIERNAVHRREDASSAG